MGELVIHRDLYRTNVNAQLTKSSIEAFWDLKILGYPLPRTQREISGPGVGRLSPFSPATKIAKQDKSDASEPAICRFGCS